MPGLTRRAYLGVLRVRARGHLLRARGEHARGSADGDDQIRSIRALDAQADVVELAGAELQELVRRHPSLDRVETRVQGIPDERRSGRDSVAHRGGGHAACARMRAREVFERAFVVFSSSSSLVVCVGFRWRVAPRASWRWRR